MNKLFTLLFAFIFGILCHLNAQEDDIHPDFSPYLSAKTTKEKIKAYYSIVNLGPGDYIYTNDTILYFIKDLHSLGIKEQNNTAIYLASYSFSFRLYLHQLYNEAEEKLLTAIQLIDNKKTDSLLSEPYNLLGNIYYLKGELETAKLYYENAILAGRKITKRTGNNIFEMLSITNLAKVNIALGDYDTAIKEVKKTIAFHIEREDLEGSANAYGTIGEAYLAKGETDLAIENFMKSMEHFLELGSPPSIANAYTNLGIAEFFSENHALSREYFILALKHRLEQGGNFKISESYFNLGDFYLEYDAINFADSALYFYQLAIDYADKGGHLGMRKESLERIAELYEKLEKEEERQQTLDLIIKTQDEINLGQSNNENLSALAEQSKRDLQELEQLLRIEKENLERRNSFLSFQNNSIIILLLLTLAGVSFYFLKRKNNYNKNTNK